MSIEVSQTVTKIVQPLETIDRSRASATSKVSVAIMAQIWAIVKPTNHDGQRWSMKRGWVTAVEKKQPATLVVAKALQKFN